MENRRSWPNVPLSEEWPDFSIVVHDVSQSYLPLVFRDTLANDKICYFNRNLLMWANTYFKATVINFGLVWIMSSLINVLISIKKHWLSDSEDSSVYKFFDFLTVMEVYNSSINVKTDEFYTLDFILNPI